MNNTNFTTAPTNPDLAKRIEKEILMEAKNEEYNVKHAIKDLSHLEKQASKSQKATVKADRAVEKAERKETTTLNDLHKAENRHDIAVSDLHKMQNDLEVESRNHDKIRQVLETKKAKVDAIVKANDEHTQGRNAKLNALHGPAAGTEASRILPEAGVQVPSPGVN